jgi:hypothetical protein
MKASLAAVILSIFALAAPGASAQQMASFQCIATSTTPGASHITIYVSQLLPMEMSQRAAISGAWGTYIKANYRLETVSTAVCQPFTMNPTYQEQALAAEETAWKRQGWDVVHVVWKPGQSAGSSSGSGTSMYGTAPSPAGAAAAIAPPSTAAPAPTGPEPRASYCFSDVSKPTIYFSDPFDTAGLRSATAWQTAFTKMLAQKYAYKGTVTCKNTSTIVSAQSMILEQRDKMQDKQFVDTDWTYEPPAPGDTAPASEPAPSATPAPAQTTTHTSH